MAVARANLAILGRDFECGAAAGECRICRQLGSDAGAAPIWRRSRRRCPRSGAAGTGDAECAGDLAGPAAGRLGGDRGSDLDGICGRRWWRRACLRSCWRGGPISPAAEANLSAAHADLAAARVAYLPNITLTANGGVAYPALAAAIGPLPGTGLAASAGASLVQTIFDGGKNPGQDRREPRRAKRNCWPPIAPRSSPLSPMSRMRWAILPHLTAQEAALARAGRSGRKGAVARRSANILAGYADFLVVTDAERTLYAARDQLFRQSAAPGWSRLSASSRLWAAAGA